MRNGKKLGPAVIFTLVLTLSPIAWAEGPAKASSLGPLDWLEAWIIQLIDDNWSNPPAAASQGEPQRDEVGNIIVPSG